MRQFIPGYDLDPALRKLVGRDGLERLRTCGDYYRDANPSAERLRYKHLRAEVGVRDIGWSMVAASSIYSVAAGARSWGSSAGTEVPPSMS